MTRLLALLFILLNCGPAMAFDPFASAGIDERHGAKLPLDLPFTDEIGTSVTLGALDGGKPILLAPVLHKCPNICGVTLSGLADAIAAQGFRPGTDFIVVAFGIDPEEGPADAATSLAELHRAHPKLSAVGVHALTGTAANIRAVTDALGYRYGWDKSIGQYAHIAAVAVLTPDGRLSRWLYGLAPDPTDLKLALTEAGRGQLGDWRDQLLLLCYHYDPKTGRYGPAIWAALRFAGGATAALLLGLVAFAFLREGRPKGGRS